MNVAWMLLYFRSHLTTASSLATKQMIVHRKICVNGQIITKPNYKLKLGDIISFSDPDEGFMANFIFMKQRQHLLDQHLKQFSRRRRRIFKLLRRKTPPLLRYFLQIAMVLSFLLYLL